MWQYPEVLKMSGCRTINIANQEHWQFVPLSLHRQNKHMELYGRCDRWRVSHGSLFSAMCAGSYFAKCTGNIVKVGMDFSGSDDTIQTIHGLGRDVDCSLYTRTVINKCWVRGFQPQQRVDCLCSRCWLGWRRWPWFWSVTHSAPFQSLQSISGTYTVSKSSFIFFLLLLINLSSLLNHRQSYSHKYEHIVTI